MTDSKRHLSDPRDDRQRSESGIPDPVCLHCGHTEIFEDHHLAGRKFHSFTWPICPTCHRLLSRSQDGLRPPKSDPPSLNYVAGRMFVGLADFIGPIVPMLERRAAALERLAKRSRTNATSIMGTVLLLLVLAAFMSALEPEIRQLGEALIDEDQESQGIAAQQPRG